MSKNDERRLRFRCLCYGRGARRAGARCALPPAAACVRVGDALVHHVEQVLVPSAAATRSLSFSCLLTAASTRVPGVMNTSTLNCRAGSDELHPNAEADQRGHAAGDRRREAHGDGFSSSLTVIGRCTTLSCSSVSGCSGSLMPRCSKTRARRSVRPTRRRPCPAASFRRAASSRGCLVARRRRRRSVGVQHACVREAGGARGGWVTVLAEAASGAGARGGEGSGRAGVAAEGHCAACRRWHGGQLLAGSRWVAVQGPKQ